MKHRIPSSALLLATALCVVPVGGFAGAPAPASEAKVVMAKELKWGDAPPELPKGAKLAVVHGDPGKEGPFVLRIRMPANYKVAPHTHPAAYNVTVLSGSPSLGMGDKVDAKAMHTLDAGSFHYLPAKTAHYWAVKAPIEMQVQGTGPFALDYVNPADNPQKSAAKQ